MGMTFHLHAIQPGDVDRLDDHNELFEMFNRDDDTTLSLEKSWDGLNRLLTSVGSEPELGFIQHGGDEVGPMLDYGHLRLFSAEFVHSLDVALNNFTDDQFWAGYDEQQFEDDGIYPGVWDEPEDELREEYVGYLHGLRKFIHRVAKDNGEFMVVLF